MTDSECKLEDFNSCPGAKYFLEKFEDQSPTFNLKFVDVSGSWKNDDATAVFTFNYDAACADERWANLLSIVHGLHPDEVDWNYYGNDVMVFRLWWD